MGARKLFTVIASVAVAAFFITVGWVIYYSKSHHFSSNFKPLVESPEGAFQRGDVVRVLKTGLGKVLSIQSNTVTIAVEDPMGGVKIQSVDPIVLEKHSAWH